MLIFYNWGGGRGSNRGGGGGGGGVGLWHFTEFRGGILISKEFSQYISRQRFPPPPPPPAYHII